MTHHVNLQVTFSRKWFLTSETWKRYASSGDFSDKQWLSMCSFQPAFEAKSLLQTKQEKGFSPVCVLICVANLQGAVYDLAQIEQVCGFFTSLVWVLMCIFKLLVNANPFLQIWQMCGFSPVCFFCALTNY